MKRLFIVSAFIALCTDTELKAQSNVSSTKNLFKFEASYIADNVTNFSGGKNKGSVYLGMANIQILFDSEKVDLWKGTQFLINLVNTHGARPSVDFLCDFQIASNIEAGDHSNLQELWIKQIIGSFEFTLGLQDLNVEFATSENAGLYLNSSFGILPIISANIPAPLFPMTTLGITAKWKLSENSAWLLAFYDGQALDFEHNPYNIKWQFSASDGLLMIFEFQQSRTINKHPGSYELGFFSRSYTAEVEFKSADSSNENTLGFYFYADQQIWEQANKNIGLFLQLGYSPSETCISKSYVGMGVNFTGILSRSKADILGLAFAHLNHKDSSVCNESIIELSWQTQLTEHVFIQPDLQYIINPMGESIEYDDCLVGILRLGFSF